MRTPRPLFRASLSFLNPPKIPAYRRTLFSNAPVTPNKNRLYNNVRRPDELHTLLLLSASSNKPLITLWSASWCTACAAVRPVLTELLEAGVGEGEGGLGFVEVELDSVEIGSLGVDFMINSMPTLLAFSRQEPQLETKLTQPEVMKDRAKLREWLETEARRGGKGGAGGSLFGGLFGRM